MDAARAMSLVVERIRAEGRDYPVEGLTAAPFEAGWCVYAPEMIADDEDHWEDDEEDDEEEVTRSVFLVGRSGSIREITSYAPADEAREWFEEACIWFAAEEAHHGQLDPSLPSHPDLGGSSRQRPAADYDREAIEVFSRALTHERDFADWLSDRLRELADLLGGRTQLTARRPRSWAAGHLAELTQPVAEDEGRVGVWRTWPAVDPASLPDVDTAGWVLVPGVRAVEFLEELETGAGTEAATRLADVIAGRVNQAPPWRACGVAELAPQLVAVPRADLRDADLDVLRRLGAEEQAEDLLDTLLVTPSPGDADVEALLRIAIDADRQHRKTIDLDVAGTAAYRRVLDRLDLPFENYFYEAMFE